MEMEESVPETTEEPQNQPQTPRSLLWSVFPSWVGLLCLFVVAWVINLTLMGLDWGIRHNLGPLRTLTISPFATIVKEFSPYSAVPCIFPVLTSQELDSFACSYNGLNVTDIQYYCPSGYICIETTIPNAIYQCFSVTEICGDTFGCASTINDLPYNNYTHWNAQTSKLFEIEYSDVPFRVEILVLICGVLLVALGIIVCYLPQIRPKRTTLYGVFFLTECVVIIFAWLFVIGELAFMLTSAAPFFDGPGYGGYDCYDQSLNAIINGASACGAGYFTIYLLSCIIAVASTAICFTLTYRLIRVSPV